MSRAAAILPRSAPDVRTQRLLEAPVMALLLQLAWPNMLVMLAQASTGLLETWWVGKLGVNALAGMALVFPGVMLMQMISGGAMGGGISSAIARALGAGRRDDADALMVHALIINGVLGMMCAVLMLLFGRPLYRLLGGSGPALEAALIYSNIVFAGNVFLWLLNALASALRGTGNMRLPGLVIVAGALVLIPLSPVLIFGLGVLPRLGIAGGASALLVYYVAGAALLAAVIWRGRQLIRFRRCRLQWRHFADILKVGAVGSVTSIQTNLTVAVTTGMIGAAFGAQALAGYGTGARLEYLLVPLVFGIGAPLVAMVGTAIGAAQHQRALQVALAGGALAFAMTETIGVACALWPSAWLSLFSQDPGMQAMGAAYLRSVGPFYGFFGLGLALYFASQGAGRLFWPFVAGSLRVLVALGGAWLALHQQRGAHAVFLALGLGLLLYGAVITVAVLRGSWLTSSAVARADQQMA